MDLELDIVIPGRAGLVPLDRPRVSVMPIQDFDSIPHPGNQFVDPQTVGVDLTYTITIQNFQQNDRIAVIVANILPVANFNSMRVHYRAALNIH